MNNQNKIFISLYAFWAVIVFALTFISKGYNPDNITHILIIIFFLVQLTTYPLIRVVSKKFSPKITFLIFGLIFAAVVEGLYMISDPLFESLKFVAGISIGKMISNFLIDLVFTIPVYIVVVFYQ